MAYEVDPHSGELRRTALGQLQERRSSCSPSCWKTGGSFPARCSAPTRHLRLRPVAAIKRLRDALRDSADNPRFVETLARRGYRFVAPVAGSLPAETKPDAIKNAPPLTYIARWVAATFALVAACISVGWHIGHRTALPAVLREMRLTATSPDVPVFRATLSPDGRLLAYTDPRGLFLREVARDDSHQLPVPQDFHAHSVTWFPDGSHLLVGGSVGEGQQSSLWNISILGGDPRKLSDQTESGAVSPDGQKIVFLRGNEKFNSSTGQ